MDVLTLIVGLLCYVTMGAVVRTHFSSATVPREVRLSIGVSYLGIAAFVYLMLRDRHAFTPLAAALTIFVVGLALFLWAVRTTRSQRLKLAFDPEQAGFLTRAGPYKYIRHPFYASYILFWLACTVATLHPIILIFLVAFTAVNLTAAYREENAFEKSPFDADYRSYRKTAGCFGQDLEPGTTDRARPWQPFRFGNRGTLPHASLVSRTTSGPAG